MPPLATALARAALLLGLLVGFCPAARAQNPAAIAATQDKAKPDDSAPSPAEIEALAKQIEDPAQRAKLLTQLRLLEKAQPEPETPTVESLGTRVLHIISKHVEATSADLGQIGDAFSDLPTAQVWLERQTGTPEARQRWANLGVALLAVIGAGLLAGLLARVVLRGMRRRMDRKQPAHAGAKITIGAVRLLLDLLPLIAFGLAASITLPWVDPRPVVMRLVAISIVNATLLFFLVRVLARFALAYDAPRLRLLPIGDENAAYLFVWITRFAAVALYGYFGLAAARLLGLPAAPYTALMKILGLALSVLAIVLVLQNRRAVAGWLKRPPPESIGIGRVRVRPVAAIVAMRRRLADVWHLLAITYIVVIWGIWSFELQGGFVFLVRATLVTLIELVVARMLLLLIDRLIRGGITIPRELGLRLPHLEERANRYIPLARQGVHVVVWVATALAILEVWGLRSFGWFDTRVGRLVSAKALAILLVLSVAVVAWELVAAIIERYLDGDGQGSKPERSARMRTLLPLIRNAFLIVLVTMVGLIVLSEVGVDIAPLLAGAGVIGLAIGFGAQTLVKDVITGVFILFENTVRVGDVVDLGSGQSGLVEAISVRTLRLRDTSGNVHTVPFSSVTSVVNMTKDYSYYLLDVGVDYSEDTDRVVDALRTLGAELQEDPNFGPMMLDAIDIIGVNAFKDSAVIIQARLKTKPIKQWAVGREFNRRMKRRFDELGISMPFPQTVITVRNLEAIAPRLGSAPASAEPPPHETEGVPPGDHEAKSTYGHG